MGSIQASRLTGLWMVLLGGCGCASSGPGAYSAGPSATLAAATATQQGDFQDSFAQAEPTTVLRGKASYYHDSLAGNTTANGDVYDPAKYTAASRELAFGTVVRVVRVDNGKTVYVRVNDRGPFRDHRRILDLSRAAAEQLDMIRAGVVDIRAEIVHRPQ